MSSGQQNNNPSATVVYGAFRDAQSKHGRPGAAPAAVPAFDLYKLAREEELTAYRGLCRVLAMHYGPEGLVEESAGPAAKYRRRLLEDLQDALCISKNRSDLELAAAAEDEVIGGIHRSGVLRRRADFFDGVEDVDLRRNHAEGRAEDDGNTLHPPPHKGARGEASTGAAQVRGGTTAAVQGKVRAAAKKKILSSITEASQEAESAANTLLYATSKEKEEQARASLTSTRETLLRLKEEIALDA